jgi:hypothetical protein
MAITEHARRQLHQHLSDTIGPEHADTLMDLLPPTEGRDLATKADIQRLSDRVDERFVGVDARFISMDARFISMDARFASMDARFDQVDHRLDQVDHRLDQVDHRLDRFEHEVDRRFTELDRSIDVRIDRAEARVSGDIRELRGEMAAGFHELRGEMSTRWGDTGVALADLRTELHRSLRINLIVTVGFLGTLISVVAMLTSTA